MSRLARARCLSEASPSPERVCECVHCFNYCLNDLLRVLSGLFLLNMMYVNMLGVFGSVSDNMIRCAHCVDMLELFKCWSAMPRKF